MSTCTFEISFTATIWEILISWDEIHSQPPYTGFVSIYFALSKPIKHTLGGGALYICLPCAATHNPQVCFYQIINTSQHTQSFSLPNSVKLSPWEKGLFVYSIKRKIIFSFDTYNIWNCTALLGKTRTQPQLWAHQIPPNVRDLGSVQNFFSANKMLKSIKLTRELLHFIYFVLKQWRAEIIYILSLTYPYPLIM